MSSVWNFSGPVSKRFSREGGLSAERGKSVCLKLRLPSGNVRDEVYLKANLEQVNVEGANVLGRNFRQTEDIEAICCF